VFQVYMIHHKTMQSSFSIVTLYKLAKITQPSIPSGSVNEYQLWLGRQKQVCFIGLVDVRGGGVQVKLKSLENACHT